MVNGSCSFQQEPKLWSLKKEKLKIPSSNLLITQKIILRYNFYNYKEWRRGPESNRRIEDLQSLALPLGYRAVLQSPS